MSDPYIGEIRAVGFTFAPLGWLNCDGSLQSISNYSALFALIGTTYGGDGVSTFALPNLQSRVIVGSQGQGPGLSNYPLGQQGGAEATTLTTNQLPAHSHAFSGSVAAATAGAATNAPAGKFPGQASQSLYTAAAAGTALAADALTGTAAAAGGSQPHSNIQPVLAIRYIICTDDGGLYPPQ